jgi:hypothetical protein
MKKQYKKNLNNLQKLLCKNGFSDLSMKGLEEIADYFDVTSRTIRNWIKEDRAPKQAIKKLENKSKHLNEHWKGFIIENDKITTPNGYRYSANEIKAISLKLALLKSKY